MLSIEKDFLDKAGSTAVQWSLVFLWLQFPKAGRFDEPSRLGRPKNDHEAEMSVRS